VPALRWSLSLAAAAGAVVGAVELFERRVLAGLDTSPDPSGEEPPAPVWRERAVMTADGGRLHVAECGSGVPILLLHGHGANLGTFAKMGRLLAANGHRVVAVDLRGFGRSSPVPDSFGFRGLVDDVLAVLTALDLHDVILTGHSMGGAIALGAAVHHPEELGRRARGLVLLNSTARGPGDDFRNRVMVTALDWTWLEQPSRHPRHGVVLARNNFGDAPRRSDVEVARTVGLQSPVEARRGFARRLLGTDLSADLPGVQLPVLVLAGWADRIVSAKESQRVVRLLPRGRLHIFEGAGHMLPLERAEAVVEQIERFSHEVGQSPRHERGLLA
jgi:pimeloyl-ACP methyl ester carboxylesterase